MSARMLPSPISLSFTPPAPAALAALFLDWNSLKRVAMAAYTSAMNMWRSCRGQEEGFKRHTYMGRAWGTEEEHWQLFAVPSHLEPHGVSLVDGGLLTLGLACRRLCLVPAEGGSNGVQGEFRYLSTGGR